MRRKYNLKTIKKSLFTAIFLCGIGSTAYALMPPRYLCNTGKNAGGQGGKSCTDYNPNTVGDDCEYINESLDEGGYTPEQAECYTTDQAPFSPNSN